MFGKQRKLEKRKLETLSSVHTEHWMLVSMLTRAEVAGEPQNTEELMTEPITRLLALEERAKNTTKIDDFGDIESEAEEWGTFKAYICPVTEIEHEGKLSINLMEEWGVPKSRVEWMRAQFSSKLSDPSPQVARSALKMILMEENSWSDYTNHYEERMQKSTYWLSGVTVALIVAALFTLRYRLHFMPLVFLCILLCGGAAGSCVSVMMKLPMLDVALSSEMDAYARRILIRVATGTVASLVGCALFAVLMVSIDKLGFADIVTACTSPDIGPCSAESCTIVKQLVLLALPILLGFSERTLTSVERKVLGEN
jgi:hypothetical protein